ncbi:hypothetical protein TEK04_16795 [Klenkia sp. LSe6-5]|uniref:Holin-X, holin superfamily III n=1 Tax=Klenkia sesuvii TaxID=3103137 RepID=A0ABU8DX08_9ACTN
MAQGDDADRGPVRHRVAGLLPPRRCTETRVDQVPAATAQQLDASDPQVVDLLRDEAGRRLDQQHATITQLDTKAAGLVAAGIALASYLLATDTAGFVVAAALVAHAGVVIMGLAALAARSWSNAPAPDKLLALLDKQPRQVSDVVLRAKVQAFAENAPNLVAKSDWVKLATWCLGLAMVLTCTARLT